MNKQDWPRYSRLLDEVLDLEPARRDDWLAHLRNEDAEAAQEVAALLKSALAQGFDRSQVGATEALLRGFSQAASGTTLSSGQSFGPWRLQRPLGEGGMGEVWLASRDDGLFEGQAALKFIRAGLAADRFLARFARERAVLARLNHPGITRLLDAGVNEGQPWLVLEYVEGRPLLGWAESQQLDVTARVRLLIATAEAVSYAHGRLVVHRDLKPSNLMVNTQGQLKLLDFGIAGLLDDDSPGEQSLTKLTGAALTPGYAAPEQIAGEPSGVAADVFALGVLLFELLTGTRPFAPDTQGRVAIEHAVLHEPAVPLAKALAGRSPVDAKQAIGLAPVVAKALEKRVEDRYESAAALIDDLQRWLDHRPLLAASTPWTRRTGLWLRRNRLLASIATAGTAALLMGLGIALWQRARALDQAQRSEQLVRYFSDLLASGNPDQHQGEWPTVLTLLEKASAELPTRFADDPKARYQLLDSVAGVLGKLGRWEDAVKLAPEVSMLAAQIYGPESEAYGRALLHQADLEIQNDQGEAGLTHARQAQALLERRIKPDDEAALNLRMQIAAGLESTGQDAAAEKAYEELLAFTREQRPDDIAEQVSVGNDFAVFKVRARRLREALDIYRQIEPLFDRVSAERRRTALQAHINMASLQIRFGEYEGVEPFLLQAVGEVSHLLGPDSTMIAGIHTHLKNYYLNHAQYAQAAEQCRLRAGLFTRRFGADDFRVLQSRQDELQAQWLSGLSRKDAVPKLLAVDAEISRVMTKPHVRRLDMLEFQAGMAQQMDQFDLAARLLAQFADDMNDPAIGRPDSALVLADLTSFDAIRAGRFDEARRHYEARDRYFDETGEGASRVQASFQTRYAYLLALMKAPEAGVRLDRARALMPPGLPATHPLHALMSYVAAVIAEGTESQAARAALAAVNRACKRPVDDPISTPIAPYWF